MLAFSVRLHGLLALLWFASTNNPIVSRYLAAWWWGYFILKHIELHVYDFPKARQGSFGKNKISKLIHVIFFYFQVTPHPRMMRAALTDSPVGNHRLFFYGFKVKKHGIAILA